MADGDKVLPEFSGKGQKEETTDGEKFYFYSPLSLLIWTEYFMDHLVDLRPAGSVTNHSLGAEYERSSLFKTNVEKACVKQV